jgi:hypothetical protein
MTVCTARLTGCSCVAQASLRETPDSDVVAQLLAPLQDGCRLVSLQLRARENDSLPEAALLSHGSLRDLRLVNCEVTAGAAARLAGVAGRLCVLHLVR